MCIASKILDPLSQENAVLEMELFESSFQLRLYVQTVSRLKSNCAEYARQYFFHRNPSVPEEGRRRIYINTCQNRNAIIIKSTGF